MTRPVLIDETNGKKATPYDTDEQAYAALRLRICELFADPASSVTESYLKDCFDTTDLDAIDDDLLNEFLSDLWVCGCEGSRGVWTNFLSSDRCSISGEFPEEQPHGNADTTIYETVGKPSGVPVLGRNALPDEEGSDEDNDEGDYD